MKNPLFVPAILSFALALAVTVGCGKGAKSETDPSLKTESTFTDTPKAPTKIGKQLRVWILPSMKDSPDFPDLNATPVADSDVASDPGAYSPVPIVPVSISGNRIIFKGIIGLMEKDNKTPRHLFIVTGEYLEGERISQMFHSQKTLDKDGHISTSENRPPALKSDVDEIWYIPLEAAIDHIKPEDADPMLDRTITLDMSFQNRGNSQVFLEMHVGGVMPAIKVWNGYMPEDKRKNIQAFLADFSAPSFYPERTTLQNPSHRKIKIWIRASAALELLGRYVKTTYTENVDTPPTQSQEFKVARGLLEQRGLRVSRWLDDEWIRDEDIPYLKHHQGWREIDLEPLESVVLQWPMAPVSLPPQETFKIPAPVTHTFKWTTKHIETFTTPYNQVPAYGSAGIGCNWVFDKHSVDETDTWAPVGAKIVGNMAIEAWASDGTLTQTEFESDRMRYYSSGKKAEALEQKNRLEPLLTLKSYDSIFENDVPHSESVNITPLPKDLFSLGDFPEGKLPIFFEGFFQ